LVEGWTVLDSLYFGVTTLTTVGYGDMGPSTDGSKIFTALYVFFGVAIVATLIGLATTFLIEAAALAAELDKKEKRELAMADDSESESDEESDEEDEAGHLVVVLPIDKEADGGGGGGGSGAQKPTCLSRCWKRGQFFFHECLPAVVCCSVGIIVMMLGQDATFVDAFYCERLAGTRVNFTFFFFIFKIPCSRLVVV
jgi:hypothetical protein